MSVSRESVPYLWNGEVFRFAGSLLFLCDVREEEKVNANKTTTRDAMHASMHTTYLPSGKGVGNRRPGASSVCLSVCRRLGAFCFFWLGFL